MRIISSQKQKQFYEKYFSLDFQFYVYTYASPKTFQGVLEFLKNCIFNVF